MMTLLKRAAVLALVLAAVPLAAGTPAATAKQKACWRVLINDWYDGRIDNFYPASCYRAAIKHAPEDLTQYSDLRSDLAQAMKSARSLQGKTYVNAGGSGKTKSKDQPRSTTSSDPPQKKEHDTGVPAGGNGSDGGGGPVGEAIQSTAPSDASAVPIPLIALAALALLLLASGATGLVARRVRARRAAASDA